MALILKAFIDFIFHKIYSVTSIDELRANFSREL